MLPIRRLGISNTRGRRAQRENQVTNASNSLDFPNQEVMAWDGGSNVDAFDGALDPHLLGIEKLPFNMGSNTFEIFLEFWISQCPDITFWRKRWSQVHYVCCFCKEEGNAYLHIYFLLVSSLVCGRVVQYVGLKVDSLPILLAHTSTRDFRPKMSMSKGACPDLGCHFEPAKVASGGNFSFFILLRFSPS